MVTHSTTFSQKRMSPVRFWAQYYFLSFISKWFFMPWPSGFCSIGNKFYKYFYISVLYLSKPWHRSGQTLTVSIFVLLWTSYLKLNVCSMFFLMIRKIMKERSPCYLLLEVQSLTDFLKVTRNGQGNTGVNMFIVKMCCILHVHKQESSALMLQEGQNERLISDAVCILLLFN